MRTLTILFLFLLALPSYSKILTLSNMPNGPGQYSSMVDVLGAIDTSDTLLVHGSPINYGSFNLIRDNIVIIGTGHNPDKQFPYVASFTDILVYGNNVQLIGITVNGINFFSNNFTMRRCKILGSQSLNYAVEGFSNRSDQNLLFESNVFVGDNPNLKIIISGPTDIATIRNNVFSSRIEVRDFSLSVTSLCLIINNLFLKGIEAFGFMDHATISNNIFYGSSPFVPNSSTIRFQNNISFQCYNNTFTNGPNIISINNLENVDPQFVNYPGGGVVFSELHDYHLAPGSPGIATGSDGSDRGVYGGFGTIFNMRGEPPISTITAVTITSPTTVPSGGTLTITVTSKRVH